MSLPYGDARKFILRHLVYRQRCDDCPGNCRCDKDALPPALENADRYVQPIRDEFAKMIDEGFFELVPLYKPTEKAFEAKAAEEA